MHRIWPTSRAAIVAGHGIGHGRRMIVHKLITLSLLGGSVLAAWPALADDAAPAESIIVLGRGLDLPPGTPAYGSVTIDRDRLSQDAAGTVEDALADVSGFQQFRRSDSRSANPSSQGVTLRALGGNASSRALVLLDGVPLADPFFGSIPFSALPMDTIGAVRVTRGGGAGAFGAGTVAGTVELFSADRAQLPLLSAAGFYGSRDAQQISATLSPEVGAGFVSVSGAFSRGDGFWTTPEDQRGSANVPARYRSWSANLRGVAPVGAQGEIQARVNLFKDDRTLRFAGADNGIEGQDASLRYLSRGDWQVEALAYVQLRNFDNIVISATSFRPTLDQRNTPATGIGGKIEVRPPVGGGHVLRIGLDTRHAEADMYEEALNAGTGAVTVRREAHGAQMVSGLYVEDDWTLGDAVLTGGLRADYWSIRDGRTAERDAATEAVTAAAYPDRDDWEASVRAGLLWHASDMVTLRAAGYTSFRLPTINELYRGFTVFPVVTQANADLAPERLRGGEVGFDLTPVRGIHLSATAFYNRLENAIANVTIGDNLRQRRNVDAITAKGIEVTASAGIGAFDLAASWANNDSIVDASGMAVALDGKQPAQSPRHSASAAIGWRAPNDARLTLSARYVGPQFEDDLETDRMPGVVTVNGYARLPLGAGLAVIGRVENLLDATVLTRKVGTSIDLGTPQTFWIGVQFGG